MPEPFLHRISYDLDFVSIRGSVLDVGIEFDLREMVGMPVHGERQFANDPTVIHSRTVTLYRIQLSLLGYCTSPR